MKVERFDGTKERRYVTAVIVNDVVCGRIVNIWDGQLFLSPWANIVVTMCVDYYKRYGKAPRKAVEGLFEAWAEGQRDRDLVEGIDKYLSALSGEHDRLDEEMNPQYVIDRLGRFFNRVRVDRLRESLEGDIGAGQVDKALSRIDKFSRLEVGAGAGIDVFRDKEAVMSAFSRETDDIVHYEGALGKFFRNSLKRGRFVAFMGPEKSTKSYHLQNLAYLALTQRRRVAFFEVGDMTEEEVKTRLYVRAARHPDESPTGKWPCTIRYPTAIHAPAEDDQGGIATADFEDRQFDQPLDGALAWEVCEKLMKNRVKSKNQYFWLSCHPAGTIGIPGIRSILEGWELQDGWTPDVVFIDYADLLESSDKRADRRDQINDVWKEMRALSMSLNCLLVTATQADADSYEKRTLSRRNFSEDKRKLAHVTGMVGINMLAEEKENDVARLNWIVRRKGKYSSRRCVHVASCLALANPCVVSTF